MASRLQDMRLVTVQKMLQTSLRKVNQDLMTRVLMFPTKLDTQSFIAACGYLYDSQDKLSRKEKESWT
jgi:hypothetical protein